MTVPSFHSHLESPAARAILAAGKYRLQGWVLGQSGENVVDVRARMHNRLFPAVHGFPRPDLATHFKLGRPFALAGFHVTVDFPTPGPVTIALEALTIDGLWTGFQEVEFEIIPPHPDVQEPAATGLLHWYEFGRALQILLREKRIHPDHSLSSLAGNLLEGVPVPRELRHPQLPFHGYLDEPAALAHCTYGRSPALGYLFHETDVIERVYASFDLQDWQPLEHNRPSPGTAALFPAWPQAGNSGIFALVDVPAQLPDPVSLRVYARLKDGSVHLCHVQRGRRMTEEDEKLPYAARTGLNFSDAVTVLKAACATRNIALVEGGELEAEIARIEADFIFRAPLTLPVVTPLAPATTAALAKPPRHALLVTHNLNFEGAPLFLADYARHLATLGTRITILSPFDGPLRDYFSQAGEVKIIDVSPLFNSKTAPEAQSSLAHLSSQFQFGGYDLVVANTLTTFWAVHAAQAAGVPSLFYIHESTTPFAFYKNQAGPAVIELAIRAFDLADCVSFTTESTRNYHLDYGRPGHHRLTPGWVDLVKLDAWRTAHIKSDLRRSMGVRDDEFLVTNIGTFSERKGQHTFVRAIAQFNRRHPALAARTRFILLGSRPSIYDETFRLSVAELNLPNVELHDATADYLPYFAAADLTTCSSYEESSPRVVLEAMACAVPLLASHVQGIPELVRDGVDATLLPPGDTTRWAEAMAGLLLNPEKAKAQAVRARERVVKKFSATHVLPLHAALAAGVAEGRF